MACGHGFVDAPESASIALRDFLHVKRDAISCDDVPAGTVARAPNFAQGLYRYLMESAALVWRVRGISWSALWPLFGLAYGMTLVAAYGLFRLGMRPPLAFVTTGLFAVSAIQIAHVVNLRDYAKAPFILALMLICAWIARSGATPRQRLRLSGMFGLVLGIGFGFRNDLLIMLPPFVAVVVLRLGGLRRRDLVLRAGCVAIAGLAFLIAAWPIVRAYSRGSNNGHVTLLGFMSFFDQPLGVQPALYDWGHYYNDSFIATLANSYIVRTDGMSVPFVSPEYDRALMRYNGDIVRNFPADIVARAYASSLKIVELPFAVGVHTNAVPYGIHAAWITDWYQREDLVLQALKGSGVYVVASALVLISAYDFAGAMFLLFVALYFAGYPAIQFHIRHFFHLEFITWWAYGFLLQAAFAAPAMWRDPLRAQHMRRAVWFLVVAPLVIVGPLIIVRAYQTIHVRGLLAQYEGRPKVAVELQRQDTVGGRALFVVPTLWTGYEARDRANISVETEYLTAAFSPAGCDSIAIPVTLVYEATNPSTDFSRKVTIPFGRSASPVSFMFAAFWAKGLSRFKGVEMAASDAGCFAGLTRTTDLRGLTLALNVMYLPDWQSHALHQSIVNWDPVDFLGVPQFVVAPGSLSLNHAIVDGVLAPAGGDARVYDPSMAFQQQRDGWSLRGVPSAPFVYLVQYQPRPADARSVFVVEGRLQRGGLTLGLIRDGRWTTYINVVEPGPFSIAIQPTEAGDYRATIANDHIETLFESFHSVAPKLRRLGLLQPSLEASIERIGWATAPGASSPVSH